MIIKIRFENETRQKIKKQIKTNVKMSIFCLKPICKIFQVSIIFTMTILSYFGLNISRLVIFAGNSRSSCFLDYTVADSEPDTHVRTTRRSHCQLTCCCLLFITYLQNGRRME